MDFKKINVCMCFYTQKTGRSRNALMQLPNISIAGLKPC